MIQDLPFLHGDRLFSPRHVSPRPASTVSLRGSIAIAAEGEVTIEPPFAVIKESVLGLWRNLIHNPSTDSLIKLDSLITAKGVPPANGRHPLTNVSRCRRPG
jgi:hypothetical protein